MLAICTSSVNPEKAGELVKELVKMMFPEERDYEREEMERKKRIMLAYSDKAFLLTGDGRGAWQASLVDGEGNEVGDPFLDGSI